MPGLTDRERERAGRGTIPQVITYICSADGCHPDSARTQFRKALTDGAIGHLRWEDSRPVDAATVSPDIPPSQHPHWVDAEINWEAGTVRDDWGEGPPRHRVMLVRWVPVRKYWPQMDPPADWDDAERYEAQGARSARKVREEREAEEAEWDAAWHAECAKGVGQRVYFSFGELADALARDPVTLIVDGSLRDRILSDLTSWHRNRQFADGEVAWLGGNPPTFAPVSPLSPRGLLASPEWTMLRRDASGRYVAANTLLPGALTWLLGASAESDPQASSTPAAGAAGFAIVNRPGPQKRGGYKPALELFFDTLPADTSVSTAAIAGLFIAHIETQRGSGKSMPRLPQRRNVEVQVEKLRQKSREKIKSRRLASTNST